jgi:AcrR family transcriptional regulator
MTPAAHTASAPREVADKRSAILAAALELFGERGFHGTAVPAVAERAGVGAGTIYRYFKSKEDLVNAIFRHWKEQIATQVLAVVDLSLPPREQFHRLWQRFFAFAAEHPRAFAFLELHHHGSYLDAESRAIEERVVDMARMFIVRLQADKVVKSIPADILMAIVYWSFVGLVRFGNECRLDLDAAAVDAAEQCVWEAIRN